MGAWIRWAAVLMIAGACGAHAAWASGWDDKAATGSASATGTTASATTDDSKSTDSTSSSAATTAGTQPADSGTPAAPAAPDAAPLNTTSGDTNPQWAPMPAITGNPGMFTVETGETLPHGGFTYTAGADKLSRDPGNITVVSYGWAFAVGITDHLSAFINFDAYNHVHVGRPDLLSLSSDTIGNPQYGNTIYRTIVPLPGATPAYVEDFPFAAQSGGGVGEVDLGFKLNVASERRGAPLSFAIKNDFYIPTQTSLADLLSNGSQNGRFNYGVGVEASKTIFGGGIVAALNAEYRLTLDPTFTVAGARETVQLADQVNLGGGFLFFPRKRFQIISEYNAEIYVGTHTPNTTFGPRDPVDQVSGFRLYLWRNFALDIAYRYMVDLTNHKDRNGFVLKFDSARWPGLAVAARPANDVINASCSVDRAMVRAGSGERAIVSVLARDSLNLPLNYSWTATGGLLQQSGPSARWDAAGLAPGTYTLSVRVDSWPRGVPATCSVSVTVQ